MEKTKVIMKVESWSQKEGLLELYIQDYSVRTAIGNVVEACNARFGGYIKLEMSPPYRPRTTGDKSQNSYIWKLITIIANETGNDVSDVEDYIKLRAVKRGYPMRENPFTGEVKPVSMATINTVEASYLIEELQQLASELGIPLNE